MCESFGLEGNLNSHINFTAMRVGFEPYLTKFVFLLYDCCSVDTSSVLLLWDYFVLYND